VSVLRRSLRGKKPDQFCIGSNGLRTVVKHYDSDTILHDLGFADFSDGDLRFQAFKSDMGREARAKSVAVVTETFAFAKPDTSEIRGIFEACHDVIWKREFESPVPAFWEFCKLMFVKLNEDKKLHKDASLTPLIAAGKPLPMERVVFSTHYIDRLSETEDSPIATLFEKQRDELEVKIARGEKKRIFDPNERLGLKPLTVRRVVELLQHHDLIRIDEDLNGRLFQTFLSATMRGKELGQFFTPRTVVEFMVQLADLKVQREPPFAPQVLDACCGTGGFLIESMAELTDQLKNGPLSSVLTEEEKTKIERTIKDERLLGIDAGKNPPVARIARINMYLHGDGGSRIYFADALDKGVRIPPSASSDLVLELEELRRVLASQRFDVALTNPPFAMRKESKEEDQREILEDYEAAFAGSGPMRRMRASLRSNVMFLQRYWDLLREGGKLVTVIDESVLNTQTNRPHRSWLLRNFYVKAVFSLPQWAFFEAGANVKTSILLLEKKSEPSDDQPTTFYGASNNIGYDGSKLDESRSDLQRLFDAYCEFKSTGKIPDPAKGHWTAKTRFFAVRLPAGDGRIDMEWLDPRHAEMEKRLDRTADARGYAVDRLDTLCNLVTGKTADLYVTQGVPIIKVRNVTGEGINWSTDFVLREFYEAHPGCRLRKDDVLVTSTGLGTIGRVDILDRDADCFTDGHVTALRVKDSRRLLSDYLVHYLRSPLGQMQMERHTIGSTGQRELNDPDIKGIRVVYPAGISAQRAVLGVAKDHERKAMEAKETYQRSLSASRSEFERSLGL
jgi:type I restriction-modification system DNA methylase subunit